MASFRVDGSTVRSGFDNVPHGRRLSTGLKNVGTHRPSQYTHRPSQYLSDVVGSSAFCVPFELITIRCQESLTSDLVCCLSIFEAGNCCSLCLPIGPAAARAPPAALQVHRANRGYRKLTTPGQLTNRDLRGRSSDRICAATAETKPATRGGLSSLITDAEVVVEYD